MEIDIRTVVIILGVTHLIQVLVFFHQYRVNKTYRGVGWWLLWSAAEVIGFGAMLFRNIPSLLPLVIIIQNMMIIAGTVFLYIGVRQFFGKAANLKLLIPALSAFTAGLLYFLFINNDISVRSGFISTILATISFFTAYSLFVDRARTITIAANFNAVIFVIHGGIFVYRTAMILAGTNVDNIFVPSLFNFLPYFDALVVSLLWTFGLIIMLNQRLNAEISEAKDDLRLIFNTSPDAAIISRLDDGLIADINEGYIASTGYTREEMSGKSTIGINIWKNITDRQNVVRLLKEKGYCENYEAIFVRKDGCEIAGLMSAKIFNLQGVPHIISITRDITERKRAAEAQQEISDRLTLACRAGSIGIWELNVSTKTMIWDDQMLILYGITRDKFGGTYESWISRVHPEDLLYIEEDLQMAIREEKDFDSEFRVAWPDGSIHNLRALAGAKRYPTGNTVIMVGTNYDITKRKQAEKELKLKNEQLHRLNSEKDKFFSIIAHDLKSPFNSIMGFSELLVEQIREKDYNEIEKYAEIILQSSGRAMDLLMNLMIWSRSQTGRMEFNPEYFELVGFIREITMLFDDIAGQKSITIIKELPHNVPVFADQAMISTILRNLISNAIKFTRPGGHITISASDRQNELIVSVMDSGIGLSKDRIDKLFRLDESYSTPGTSNELGTGLGLILCKEFVEKHAGKIWVESEEENLPAGLTDNRAGKAGGSTFHFTIPNTSAIGPTTEFQHDDPTEFISFEKEKLKILVAEDNEVSAMYISSTIKLFSKEILKVRTGAEAVEICRTNPDIDLVLMDIAMPEMGGYEATRQIRQFNKNVIIIAQTASGLIGDRNKAIEAGCNDHISKPFSHSSIELILKRHFK